MHWTHRRRARSVRPTVIALRRPCRRRTAVTSLPSLRSNPARRPRAGELALLHTAFAHPGAGNPRDMTQTLDERRAPEGPSELRTRSWFGVLKRTVTNFSADNLTDWAAALTYYGVLAIFPALIALVSILD